jgi:hypothetical protein
MIRATTAPASAHALMLVSTGKGLAFQRRTDNGATSASTSGGSARAPRFVRLKRAGNLITASASVDGTTWTVVGTDIVTLPATILVGLASSSHSRTAAATASLTNVRIVQ